MKRTRIKAKDANKLLEPYNIEHSKKDKIESVQTEKYKLLVINDIISFFYYNNTILPTLKYLQTHPNILRHITVDMGAVKFVIKGADIMRPGITNIADNIAKEEFITIVDENNQKPLAIGIALLDTTEMQNATSGKVIKNIHYVGDEVWNL